MAAPVKHTVSTLKKGVTKYFKSICVKTELKDAMGNTVTDNKGRPVLVDTYIRPPGKASLALSLGIDRRTWLNYSDHKLHPEFSDITSYANTRIEAWLEEQISIREKPQGVKFNLEANFGWGAKTEISLEKETREAVLGATMEEKLAAIMAAAASIPKDDDDE